MENEPMEDLVYRAKLIQEDQQLGLQQLTDLVERTQQEIQLIQTTLRALNPSNENQPFLCVLLLMFVEAIDGITVIFHITVFGEINENQEPNENGPPQDKLRKVRLSVF